MRGKSAGIYGACGNDAVAVESSTPAENRVAALLAAGIWPFSQESFNVSDVPGAITEPEAVELTTQRLLLGDAS